MAPVKPHGQKGMPATTTTVCALQNSLYAISSVTPQSGAELVLETPASATQPGVQVTHCNGTASPLSKPITHGRAPIACYTKGTVK